MLVLSRKIGQSVRLGEDVRITIVKSDRNTVRIGIEAPEGVSIRRGEIVVGDVSLADFRHAAAEAGAA